MSRSNKFNAMEFGVNFLAQDIHRLEGKLKEYAESPKKEISNIFRIDLSDCDQDQFIAKCIALHARMYAYIQRGGKSLEKPYGIELKWRLDTDYSKEFGEQGYYEIIIIQDPLKDAKSIIENATHKREE